MGDESDTRGCKLTEGSSGNELLLFDGLPPIRGIDGIVATAGANFELLVGYNNFDVVKLSIPFFLGGVVGEAIVVLRILKRGLKGATKIVGISENQAARLVRKAVAGL